MKVSVKFGGVKTREATASPEEVLAVQAERRARHSSSAGSEVGSHVASSVGKNDDDEAEDVSDVEATPVSAYSRHIEAGNGK